MAKTFTPSPQQSDIFAYVEDPRGGNAIVEAVAGAGKTTTLVHACELMEGDVALVAYNTKMAKELREKTAHLGGKVWAKTFHSFGMNMLKFRLKGVIKEADDKKVRKLIDAFIQEKGRKDLEEVASCVASCVSMAKQRGIRICFPDTNEVWLDMIQQFSLDEDLPEGYEDRMDIIIKMSRCMLTKSNDAGSQGVIDFDDMIYLPLLWNLRAKRFNWVLVDEAQDTNPTRREFAKRLLVSGGRLIAVGDPRQAIYGFSGADNDALDQITRAFDATTYPLTTTYRCPKAVVEVAQRYVSHIEAHESAPEGLYTEQPFEVVVDQLQPGDAVLCRYNKYLVNLCFKLIRNGKPARIEGRAIGAGLVALTRKWKEKNLERLAERVQAWSSREVKKAEGKQNDAKADQIRDRAETLLVLIERGQEQGCKDADALRVMIAGMFDDNVADSKSMITLCSVHKSKGMEWPRVYVLGLDDLMGRECSQPWQSVQEINLQYVAVTRAQELLVNVTGVKEEKKQHQFGEGA